MSKGIDRLVNLQQPDGSWGHFHSLSKPTSSQPKTTEQALRRLWVLGMRAGDAPIDRAIGYMRAVLDGHTVPPDRREHVLNWDVFERMMMAAWIKRFSPDDDQANEVADFWASLIKESIIDGAIDQSAYEKCYRSRVPKLHKGERCISIRQFYMVTLLRGRLDDETEHIFFDAVLHFDEGIYYVYPKRIADVPDQFCSREASHYLAALECLSGYRCASEKLAFAADWIRAHEINGGYDMSAAAKDGIYFPIADSWVKPEQRIADCTRRIEALLGAISK